MHPTSRSAAAHILQHSDGALALSLDPRLGCAPLRAPLHRSRQLRGVCGSRDGFGGSAVPTFALVGDGSSSDFLAALSFVVLPREAHIDVQRSGFVLLSFSSVSRGASPKGRSACARRPKTSRAVCLECPPPAGCFQLACGVKRLRCSGERRVCFAAPGVSPLAAHPCTTDWPIQMGL